MSSTVSLIIPTLNAEQELSKLLEILLAQSTPINEIVIVDSSSEDNTQKVALQYSKAYPNITLHVINRSDFNHGKTRDTALREWTTGEFVLFMTQDAFPANHNYVQKLIAPFEDLQVGVVSGRQLPKQDARRFEQLVREHNYPNKSFVRSKEDLKTYGIKTFYTSDVCAAYRREVYLACGGFPSLNMSEDMYMAAQMIAAGYKVAYAADAQVYHSHNLTPQEQYTRNYQIGYFLGTHKDILMGANEIGEGKKLVKQVSKQLIQEKRIGEFMAFGVDCMARLTGNRAGRKAAAEAGYGDDV